MPQSGPQELATPPPGALCVLVVEDNAADAMIASAAVARSAAGPYVLLRAEKLAPALELLASHDVHLVLLDLHLPDSKGLETLRRVRAATACPVIVITTEEAPDIDEAALEAGAFEVLHKGRIDVDVLARLLRLAERHGRTRRTP